MHSDPTKLSAPPSGVLQDAASEGMDPVLARRRLLLRGLGKGAAAAAALSPLASQATRSFKLDNPAISGDGYCSVSGFHSAVISLAPGGGQVQPCSAPGPQTYFSEQSGGYSHAAGDDEDRRNKMRSLLSGLGVNQINDSQLDALAVPGASLVRNKKVILNTSIGSSGTGGTLAVISATTAYPTGQKWRGGATFAGLLADVDSTASSAQDSLLYLLRSYQNDDKAYVVAAFLGCIREDNGSRSAPGSFATGPIPFDAKYVADQYNSNAVAAVPFFKRLCGG